MVEGLLCDYVTQVAAARDHTVVLTEEGNVYTFGLNRFHQLGLNPPPASSLVPKHVRTQGCVAVGGVGGFLKVNLGSGDTSDLCTVKLNVKGFFAQSFSLSQIL